MVGIMVILISNPALGTNSEIPIFSSDAKSWYKDDGNRDLNKPSNAHDNNFNTFYSVKDGDTAGNFLKLYFSDLYVVNRVDITNRLDTCCSNRLRNTAAFVYFSDGLGHETEVKYCGKITGTSTTNHNLAYPNSYKL